jgi:protein-disulfide isomerase
MMKSPVPTPVLPKCLLLATLMLGVACPSPADVEGTREAPCAGHSATPGEVARWNTGSIPYEEIEGRVGQRLRELRVRYELDRHQMLSLALDAAIEDSLLRDEVERRDLDSLDDLLKSEVDGKTAEPTEEELRAAFENFRQQVPSARFEEARAHLSKEFRRVKREDRYRDYMHEVRMAAGLEVLLPYPDIPRTEVPLRKHDPQIGPDDAKVTLVQFAEYQCYYCRQAAPTLVRLVDEFDGQVRVVFKDFPLRGHARARAAAVAAQCAGQQDRYWEVGARLFDAQGNLSDADLIALVRELGLDVRDWQDCVDDPAWHNAIDEDVRDGLKAGVTSTPTFFMNGLMVTGALPYERLESLVRQELAAVSTQ